MRAFLAVSLLALLLFPLSLYAASEAEETAKIYMDAGGALAKKKRYSEAILEYQKALEILPEASGPHRELGKCYEKLKKYDEAIHHYVEYLRRKPDAKQRPEIVKLLPTLRTQLPTPDRALLSVQTTPSGALVYVATEKGEERAIGISPIVDHPIELRFEKIKAFLPSGLSAEQPILLTLIAPTDLTLELKAKPTPVEVIVPKLDPATSASLPTSEPASQPQTAPASQPTSIKALTPTPPMPVSLPSLSTEFLHPAPSSNIPPVFYYATLGAAGASLTTLVLSGAMLSQTTQKLGAALEENTLTPNTQTQRKVDTLAQQTQRQTILADVSLGTTVLFGAAGLYALTQTPTESARPLPQKVLFGVSAASLVATLSSGVLFGVKNVALQRELKAMPSLSVSKQREALARSQSLSAEATFWAKSADLAFVLTALTGAASLYTLKLPPPRITLRPFGLGAAVTFSL